MSIKVDFTNKVVLLTGASSGIGCELAKKLACFDGIKLVLAARRKNLMDVLAEKICNSRNSILALKCDVAVKEEIAMLVSAAVDAFGNIDAAILNSGTSYRMSHAESSLLKTEEIMKVNTLSYLYFFDQLIPLMKDKGGIIAGITSLAGTRGFPYSGVYSASKAASARILESYRGELRKFNIRVINVKPGFVRTPMTDKNKFYMPMLMEPDRAASIILKGLKKEKRVIQFPWPVAVGAKLIKLVPNSIFDYFAAKVR